MEPNLSLPTPSAERGSPRKFEAPKPAERVSDRELEALKEGALEQQEAQSTPLVDPIVVPALPASQMLPALQSSQAHAASTPLVNDAPLIAADEDLIEKEWVDKAKKIVAETKSDPYSQEDQVSKLQADYIKKRYGKDIAVNSK